MATTLYQLRPDVPGELGSKTVWELPSPERPHGPTGVLHVEYELYHWYGDCLIKASPIYAVTEPVAQALRAARLTGFELESMEVSFAGPYASSGSPPPAAVPRLLRLLATGKLKAEPRRPLVLEWDGQDLSESNVGLVVTARALSIFQEHGLTRCVVRPLTFPG
jgi:hypothetical protein